MEVPWKTVSVIMNRRLGAAITLHGVLHGLRAGRGYGTASLEAKLIPQLTAMSWEVLYVIFLDLHKAHDALDRDRYFKILNEYRLGPQDLRLLKKYWDRLTMVTHTGVH